MLIFSNSTITTFVLSILYCLSLAQPLFAATTTTFSTLSSDGHVHLLSTTWSGSHDTANGDWVDYTGTILEPYVLRSWDNYWFIQRAFLAFNTASIPDTAIITQAKLYIYPTYIWDQANDGYDYLTVVQGLQQSTSSLAYTDYSKNGNAVTNPTEGIATSERKDLTSISSNSWLSFTLNATGTTWITATSTTKFGLREGHDVTNTQPSLGTDQSNTISIASSERSGTSTAPYLEVEYIY